MNNIKIIFKNIYYEAIYLKLVKIFSKKLTIYNKENNRARINEKMRNIYKLIKSKISFT